MILGVVGATGAVGEEILSLLQERRLAVTGGTVVGFTAGLALVAHDRFDPGAALAGVFVGGAAGALVGRGLAQFTADTSEGRWGGLTIGMGVGAIAGTLIATLAREPGDEGHNPAPTFAWELPLSLPGLGR